MEISPAWHALLKSVSRSFYLSLRFLPAGVRGELSVAYLLARASDSIADSASAAASERLVLLEQFSGAMSSPAPEGFFSNVARLQVDHPGEQILLQRLGDCFEQYQTVDESARRLIQTVLGHILHGQRLDLQRFPGALQTPDELTEYTYLVAGCVGEFWTEMLALKMPNWTSLPREEMLRLGREYGQGLQLVNILRDLPGDLADGRSYLPGTDELLERRDFWAQQARLWLSSGERYASQLKGWRLRFTADLPWRLGLATLEALPKPEIAAVKVSRKTVRKLMFTSAWRAWR
jgi:farnesyl-diphosphate farnesyltransferase